MITRHHSASLDVIHLHWHIPHINFPYSLPIHISLHGISLMLMETCTGRLYGKLTWSICPFSGHHSPSLSHHSPLLVIIRHHKSSFTVTRHATSLDIIHQHLSLFTITRHNLPKLHSPSLLDIIHHY